MTVVDYHWVGVSNSLCCWRVRCRFRPKRGKNSATGDGLSSGLEQGRPCHLVCSGSMYDSGMAVSKASGGKCYSQKARARITDRAERWNSIVSTSTTWVESRLLGSSKHQYEYAGWRKTKSRPAYLLVLVLSSGGLQTLDVCDNSEKGCEEALCQVAGTVATLNSTWPRKQHELDLPLWVKSLASWQIS